jgi:predicted DCC family thiol-disulfide oxidoreductase YuxK
MLAPAKGSDYQIEVFYDGDCPLCLKEIQMLQWMDRKRRQIRFTDIAASDFHPEDFGKTMSELMDQIHGRTPEGEWLVGVEVFRRLYAAVGFGPLVWPTRLPGVKHLLDLGYEFFAKYRLRLTGRCEDNCKLPNTAAANNRSGTESDGDST